MEKKTRRKCAPEFKGEAVKLITEQGYTFAEAGRNLGVNPNQISKWKRQVVAELPGIFSDRRKREVGNQEEIKDRLYQQIGQLQVELDWLKKKSGLEP